MNEPAPPITTRTPPARESERTCVGCRRRAPTGSLARLALEDGTLRVWGAGRARPAGRGASLHREASCLGAALRSGAFARAFRGAVKVGNEADLLQQLQRTEDKSS
ncbi:MAG TPA: YlxR family protein [Polyangia bacterium]|nr:YlxR family protein [Polyangia bacterium]